MAAIMVFGLSGCVKSFDATGYVQAEMDLLTRHDVEQYVETLGVTEEKAEEIYDEIIEEMNISENVLQGIEVSDEVEKAFEDWFVNVLSKTKYTVLEAEKVGDDYVVVVEVQPIKAFEGMMGTYTEKTEAYLQQLYTDAAAGGEVPSDEEISNDVYMMLVEVLNDILENATYGETISVETKIVLNEDGEYEVDEASFASLGEKLIDITDSTDTSATE